MAFDAQTLEFNVEDLVNSVPNESVIWNAPNKIKRTEMAWIQ